MTRQRPERVHTKWTLAALFGHRIAPRGQRQCRCGRVMTDSYKVHGSWCCDWCASEAYGPAARAILREDAEDAALARDALSDEDQKHGSE